MKKMGMTKPLSGPIPEPWYKSPPPPPEAGWNDIIMAASASEGLKAEEKRKADAEKVLEANRTKTEGVTGVTQPVSPTDISGTGTQEKLWESHGGDVLAPSESEKALPGINKKLEAPGNSKTYFDESKPKLEGNKNAQAAFDAAMGMVTNGPQTSNYQEEGYKNFDLEAPDLDIYYDRQAKKAEDRLNRSFAARGMYGSSEATNNISDAMQGLGAEQANREADYNLARLAEKRGWATGADSQSLGTEGLRVDGYKNLTAAGIGADKSLVDSIMAGGDLAKDADDHIIESIMTGIRANQAADDTELERFQTTVDFAGDVQGRREDRVTQGFDNKMKIPNRLAPEVNETLGGAIDKDSESLATEIELTLGIPREEINQIMQREGIDLNDEAAKQARLTTALQTGAMIYTAGLSVPVTGAPGQPPPRPPTPPGT